MITAGGNFEASLLALPDIWKDLERHVDGDIVVAIPARDLLLMTGFEDAGRNRQAPRAGCEGVPRFVIPADIYLVRAQQGEVSEAPSAVMPDHSLNRTHTMTVQPASLERKTYVCQTTLGHALEVDVIGGNTETIRPCVMWIHGGGLIFGSRTTSPRPFLVQALVERGFVIASVDHRLAPEAKLEEIVADIGELWRWLHHTGPGLFGADPRRICAAGASAGAYLSLIAGYKLTPKPRAVASLWGFGDITAPWEADPSEHYRSAPLVSRSIALASLALTPIPTASGEDRSQFYLYCRQQGRWLQEVAGHSLPGGKAFLDQYCPLRHIEEGFPPTVLVHGRNDSDVPASESDCLATALRDKGVPHEYHSLPGVGHGFAGATVELVQSTEQAVAEFLHAHIVANAAQPLAPAARELER